MALVAFGGLGRALEAAEMAVSLDGTSRAAHGARAEILGMMGRVEEAEEAGRLA